MRNEEFRSSDDVARVTNDGTITTKDHRLAYMAMTDGFDLVVDLNGRVTGTPVGYDLKQAAKVLGVPVPVVKRWADSGELKAYYWREHFVGFACDDVDRFAASRQAAKDE